MSDNPLVIETRLFALLDWLLPKAERFPKAYRHTLTAHMMKTALAFNDHLAEAQALRGTARQEALSRADARLSALRVHLRLAHQWRWLSDGQYRHVSAMVAEIGRLLGGWLRRERGA